MCWSDIAVTSRVQDARVDHAMWGHRDNPGLSATWGFCSSNELLAKRFSQKRPNGELVLLKP